MPIKLIGILLLITLVAVLTGFNLSNPCTIWFFHRFENIPVFAALLGSFLAGVIVTLPFTFKKRQKCGPKEKCKNKKIQAVKTETLTAETKENKDKA
ncbi:MAG: hypothetical protein J6K96_07360 [Treponema sp.]|nr:hypothetical protein [Treponema sp.]